MILTRQLLFALLYSCIVSALNAVIYTGFAAYCDDGETAHSACWDAAGWLLGNSSLNFDITFLNHTGLLSQGLSDVDLYVQPGGGDADTDYDQVWSDASPLSSIITDYVQDGGRYLGICQGAYLAGNFSNTAATVGFDMLPSGILVDEEIIQDGAEVTTDDDAIIKVDYTLSDGTVLTDQYQFFQDGSTLLDNTPTECSTDLQVVAQYSTDGDIAIALMPYGSGVIGLTGPHIEADSYFWYGFTNPNNPNDPTNGFIIGFDFLNQLMNATPTGIQEAAISACSTSSSQSQTSTSTSMTTASSVSATSIATSTTDTPSTVSHVNSVVGPSPTSSAGLGSALDTSVGGAFIFGACVCAIV